MSMIRLFALPALTAAALVSTASAQLGYAVSGNLGGIDLLSFNAANPGGATTVGALSGLLSGHQIRAVDFRPSNGLLYGVSTSSASPTTAQLYTINLTTAACTPVGGTFTVAGNNGFRLSMDFNPVADVLRVTAGFNGSLDTGSYRVNPDTGALIARDSNIESAAGDPHFGQSFFVGDIAYSNNFVGATQTTLYSWEYLDDLLATIGGVNGSPSPNGGEAFTVFTPAAGRSGLAIIGLDIAPSGVAYASHDGPGLPNGRTGFFTLDLSTGAETSLGLFPAGVQIMDFAMVTPTPGTGAALGLGGLIALRRRR